jgi:hypothetical protein
VGSPDSGGCRAAMESPNGGRSLWPAGADGGGGRGRKEVRWSTGVKVRSRGEAVAARTVESGGEGLLWRLVEGMPALQLRCSGDDGRRWVRSRSE